MLAKNFDEDQTPEPNQKLTRNRLTKELPSRIRHVNVDKFPQLDAKGKIGEFSNFFVTVQLEGKIFKLRKDFILNLTVVKGLDTRC